MENVRILDLKRALFYYFLSWRTSLLCIFICVALAIGLVYLRPAEPQVVDEGVVEQQEPSLAEKRAQFVAENAEAKAWAAEIAKLEGEKALLENELSNSLFLQIDPDHRINKHFDVRFTYFMADFEDEEEKVRADQMLCLHYMKQLSGDRYMNYLATKGLLKFDPTALIALVDVTLNETGYIEFTVTGPEEVVIDQLIDTTKDFLERIVRPEIDLFATHFLTFGETTKEVVEDPNVLSLKNRIESEVTNKGDNIDELNQMIDRAFEESLKDAGVEKQKDVAPVQPSRTASLKKNIVLGILLGLFVSALITAVRYRRQIMRTDVTAIARENNISYLGEVTYYSEMAQRRNKRFGNGVDRFFIRLFGMAYDSDIAANQADYVAQVLQGLVEAKTEKGDTQPVYSILVPNVRGDVSATSIVTYIRKTLGQDDGIQRVSLIDGGSLEFDSDTIEIARESCGLLLLSKPSDKVMSMVNSIQRGNDLSKEILGIFEMDERW